MMGYVFLVISLSCDLFCLNAALGILKTLKILVRNRGHHTKTYSTMLNVSFLPRECVWKLLQKGKGRATYTIFGGRWFDGRGVNPVISQRVARSHYFWRKVN